MNNILINISELKSILSRLSLAVETTKLNPKSGWVELETVSSDTMTIKVSNYGYYLKANVTISAENYTESSKIHATVTANTFISLVSRLDDDYIAISQNENTLLLASKTSEYTFSLIKELDKIRSVDEIVIDEDKCDKFKFAGADLATIADSNVRGLIEAQFAKEVQKFIYVDNNGAVTFTDNIYVNTFKNVVLSDNNLSNEFKFLLNANQAKLLDVFEKYQYVEMSIERVDNEMDSFKVRFSNVPENEISVTFIVQNMDLTNRFPVSKIRDLASTAKKTHAVIEKKAIDRALARLMVFDKKWDISVMNYSKLVFEEDHVKLVSIKNKNYEIIPYKSHENTVTHESIIRFADLEKQLKAVSSADIDISYGDTPAITINSDGLIQVIPEIRERV